ncbi:hypothetical protein Enr13x_38480 [Stieleria neptunia]|uniref:Secreted protein n=1 Tax=Stieleria neptunia TaxID=2527979 RepID=A0A518HT18_9BACT|nr:hypothetical protein [Stieleria neptunia]QDV43987.1 hypothetical protein Enr13x_38480 [Stieleria neptunia]
MSRLIYSFMFAFCASILSISAVGCGETNTVIEDTRSEAEIEQEAEDYEAQMEEDMDSDVTE